MGPTLWASLLPDQPNTDHEDLYFQWLQQEEGGAVAHCGRFVRDGRLTQEGHGSLEGNGISTLEFCCSPMNHITRRVGRITYP